MVIVLDDLHDADVASLTMLRLVARELRGSGILIVGTYRAAEVQRSPALSPQIGELVGEARSLPLVGLSAAEVGQFSEVVGTFTIDQYDPTGTLLAEVKGTLPATRLTVDSTINQLL